MPARGSSLENPCQPDAQTGAAVTCRFEGDCGNASGLVVGVAI
jgi:hypothetical protein